MWRPGTPVTLDGTTQVLTTTVDLVKAIRFFPDPNNTHVVFWGDTTLDPSTSPKTGVSGIIGNPTVEFPAPEELIYETDAPNGIHAGLIRISGTANEILMFSYLEQ